jgi:hypothetical protein
VSLTLVPSSSVPHLRSADQRAYAARTCWAAPQVCAPRAPARTRFERAADRLSTPTP